MASCVLLGHTGAVGKCVLREVMADPRIAKVTTIGRREIAYDGPNKEKLVQQVVDFEKLDEYRAAFQGHDAAFCSLGTTRAEAGGAEAFRRIDHDYVVNAAKLIKEEAGDKPLHFFYVSAQGTNINSPFLYPKTKGQIEKELTDLKFDKLTIMRPALLELEGDRPGSRFGETVAFAMLPAIKFFSPTGVSIPVGTVAKAMVGLLHNPHAEAARIYENKEIHSVAKAFAEAGSP
ncbi:hypothetical protein H9P43_009646 [Blastocladiella emersonii ATCC 22665]|nr:hypothetical protein H9P43_009646 [Blastocladiella emersonii ATCC 22665]